MSNAEQENFGTKPIYTVEGLLHRLHDLINKLRRDEPSVTDQIAPSPEPSIYETWPDAPDAYIQRHGSAADKTALAERDRLKNEQIGHLPIGGGMVRKFSMRIGTGRTAQPRNMGGFLGRQQLTEGSSGGNDIDAMDDGYDLSDAVSDLTSTD